MGNRTLADVLAETYHVETLELDDAGRWECANGHRQTLTGREGPPAHCWECGWAAGDETLVHPYQWYDHDAMSYVLVSREGSDD